MVIEDFQISRIPKTVFGAGSYNKLAGLMRSYGSVALIITGGKSLERSGKLDMLLKELKSFSMKPYLANISGEPSPESVDRIVNHYRHKNISLVVSVGGGSVMDAGKAISAMLTADDSVLNYLEGIGKKTHSGQKVPFFAVPTTAGTGSEATKNAVLSTVAENGYKKSLRHDNFMPDLALIDPELTLSCPPGLSSACAMDALTQLIESYLSPKASAITDSLVLNALSLLKNNIIRACNKGAKDIDARSALAYASYISGIALANAGLGIVHGLASPIGSYFEIPHGVVCGTLISSATRKNIELLQTGEAPSALEKYAAIGKVLSGTDSDNHSENISRLIQTLDEWTEKLHLPRLGAYGIREKDASRIAEKTSMKENPVIVSPENIVSLLLERI